MIKIITLLFLTSFMSLAFADKQDQKHLAFQLLQKSLIDYADKHDICDHKKQQNKLTDNTIKQLKSVDKEVLRQGIMYLSEQAFNHCLQPERGLLAERLLQIQSWPEDKNNIFDRMMLLTMESSNALIFNISVANTEVIFYALSANEQAQLLKIEAMQRPFEPMIFWEASENRAD